MFQNRNLFGIILLSFHILLLVYEDIFILIGIDLAMLSLADHSILSYGTFGIWGALLAKGGEVVVPKLLLNETFSQDIIQRQWQKDALNEEASMDAYGYEIPDSWISL